MIVRAAAGFAALILALPTGRSEVRPGAVGPVARGGKATVFCAAEAPPGGPGAPAYYAFDMVTTKRVPGTGLARGEAQVTFAPSPFSVSLAPDGSYAYDLRVRLEGLRAPREGTLVAWVTTRELDHIRRLGPLDSDLAVHGRVEWNKFLVVITLEARDDASTKTWSGPVAFRGMSRSGMMHTMAGHGAFQQENCAAYGYAN